MNKDPRQDRKRILADPVAVYRNRHPQATSEQVETLRSLHHNHVGLLQQHRDVLELTRRLSRQIGTAKRNNEPVDALLADMKTHSTGLKDIAANLQQAETSILGYITPEEQAPHGTPTHADRSTSRYTATTAPPPETVITTLADETGGWNAYVAGHPSATIYHRAEWRLLVNTTFGHDCPYFMALAPDRTIVGVLPLVRMHSRLFGHFMISMPYFNYGGAIADHPLIEQRLMQAASEYAAANGVQHIEYRDTLPRDGLPVRSRKVCMLLPLPDSHEVLWQRFSSKLRAQIRRPLQEHPEVIKGGLENLDDFYSVFTRNMRDLGTPVYGKAFFENILNTFPSESAIVIVRLAGKPVAAAFLLGHGEQLEIPWASTIRDVNHLSMNMLLYWEVLKLAIDRDYRVFDFGRSSRDSGTFRFKQQWGAQPMPLYWHYWLRGGGDPPELNPDNPKYALAIRAWQHLPLWMANRIGPAVVKYLP